MGVKEQDDVGVYQLRKIMTHVHEEEEHLAPRFKNIAFLSLIKV